MPLPSEGEIRWGTGNDNALSFAYPAVLDSKRVWRRPAPGSRFARNPAGTSDSWIQNRDFMLAGTVRWFSSAAWGGLGLQDFLDWAVAKNSFRFIPDRNYPNQYVDNCYLEEPADDPQPRLEESDGSQSIDVVIRQQAFDFNWAIRGLLFEYVPGKSLTDPSTMVATFSRGSTGMRTGRDGVLASEASGTLRDRHFVTSFATRATLLEDARTNDFTRSEEFDNAAWTLYLTTVSANAATAPDGTTTADKVVEGAPLDNHGVLRALTGAADNTKQSVSYCCKAGERIWVRIRIVRKDGGTPSAWFNLSTGAWGTVEAGVAATSVEVLANGWYRLGITVDVLSGGTAPAAQLFLATGDAVQGYAGDGTSGLYVWGGQYEKDKPSVSSYVKTVSATVTRSADRLYFPFGFAPQIATFYLKYEERGAKDVDQCRLFEIGNTSDPRIFVLRASGQYFVRHGVAAAVAEAGTGAITLAIGDIVEIRAVLRANGSVLIGSSVNGGAEAVSAASSALTPGTAWSASRLTLGADGVGTGVAPSLPVIAFRVAAGEKTMAEMRVI